MELVEQLKNDAINKGLCALWQRKLKPGMTTKDLVQLYVEGIDFCVCEDFPTLEFLRNNFKGACEEFGVFVDDDITESINMPDMVLNGACRALLEYTEYSVSRIFMRHTSKAAINVSDHAIVTIDAFDDTELVVATSNKGIAYINLYGNANVEAVGSNIKIRRINKSCY